ncbi:hypothetical protein ScPMuIL_007169 [Solemya velum]
MPTVPPVDYGWQSEKSILECHQHMLEEEVAADVTFIVGKKKQEVRAHKYMLICRSPVFHAMFCGPLAEDNNINIPDIEPDVFLVFLSCENTPGNIMPTVPPVDYGWQSKKTITECHQHMLEEGIATDVTFLVGKEKQIVRAHKYMLICRSPVFQAMFCGPQLLLSDDNKIVIPDIEPDVFLVLLRFIYYYKPSLSDSTVLSVLYAAKKYLVSSW